MLVRSVCLVSVINVKPIKCLCYSFDFFFFLLIKNSKRMLAFRIFCLFLWFLGLARLTATNNSLVPNTTEEADLQFVRVRLCLIFSFHTF